MIEGRLGQMVESYMRQNNKMRPPSSWKIYRHWTLTCEIVQKKINPDYYPPEYNNTSVAVSSTQPEVQIQLPPTKQSSLIEVNRLNAVSTQQLAKYTAMAKPISSKTTGSNSASQQNNTDKSTPMAPLATQQTEKSEEAPKIVPYSIPESEDAGQQTSATTKSTAQSSETPTSSQEATLTESSVESQPANTATESDEPSQQTSAVKPREIHTFSRKEVDGLQKLMSQTPNVSSECFILDFIMYM